MAEKKKKKTVKKYVKKYVTSYKMIEECRVLAGHGLTTDQLAYYFKLKPITLHRMIARDPVLKEAIKNGKSVVIAEIAGLLVQKAREGNVSAMVFYLKTQARWNEFNNSDNPPPDKPKISYSITTTDPVEAARIYQQIMTGS
jgi:hypothetical protein